MPNQPPGSAADDGGAGAVPVRTGSASLPMPASTPNRPCRVLIAGGGGLGTVLAGYLGRAGHDVTLFVKPAQAALLLSAGGLEGSTNVAEVHISGLAAFTASVTVASEPSHLDAYDYLLVCVKARDTEVALAPLAGVNVGAVLSLQNGVAKDAELARVFGSERVLGAVCMVGGSLQRPGYALHTLAGATLIGEPDGSISERGERLASAFRSAGLEAACVAGIIAREWHKLAIFLRTALVCSIVRADIATVVLDADLVRVGYRVSREVADVAAAAGHPVDGYPVWAAPAVTFGSPEDEVVEELSRVGRGLRDQGVPLYPSLAQDTIAGRPTELEDTAGDVTVRAARLGVATPVLTSCYRLLRGMANIPAAAPITDAGLTSKVL